MDTRSKSFTEVDTYSLEEVNEQNSAYELDEKNSSVVIEEICNQFKEVLVTMVVEIGDGREVPITIHYEDKAEDLAKSFALAYKLPNEVMLKLAESIQFNIDQAISKGFPYNRSTHLNESPSINSINIPQRGDKARVVEKDMTENRLRASTPITTTNKKSKSKLTPEVISSVQRLYANAVKNKQQRTKINQLLKQEKEMESMECTFKPKIDLVSKKLMEITTKHRLFEDRINYNIQKNRQKINELRDSLYLEEKLKCPFKPKINQNTKVKTLSENIKQKKSVQELGSEYTFHPNINTSQNAHKGTVKFNKIEKDLKPKISGSKKISRNRGNSSIGEHLYLKGKKQINMKIVLQTEAMLKELKEHNKNFVQSKSNKILEKKKRSTFDSVFKTLDPHSNGTMSAKTPCIQSTLVV
jgi:hypothetical protein